MRRLDRLAWEFLLNEIGDEFALVGERVLSVRRDDDVALLHAGRALVAKWTDLLTLSNW